MEISPKKFWGDDSFRARPSKM